MGSRPCASSSWPWPTVRIATRMERSPSPPNTSRSWPRGIHEGGASRRAHVTRDCRRASARPSRMRSKPSAAHRRYALFHLLRRHILDVRGDVPPVAERILELPGAVSIELVLHRCDLLGARLDRASEHVVD